MENRNITQERLTDEEWNRIRKNARAFVEETCRKENERVVLETTIGSYNRIARQAMLAPRGNSIFCGIENHG